MITTDDELQRAAFHAGYDAGWGASNEGHNSEYASPRFTSEAYSEAQIEAYREWREETARAAGYNPTGIADASLIRMTSSTEVAVSIRADDLRAENDKLRELVRRIPIYTKHGPGGTGDSGPCSTDCLKCAAEKLLKELP